MRYKSFVVVALVAIGCISGCSNNEPINGSNSIYTDTNSLSTSTINDDSNTSEESVVEKTLAAPSNITYTAEERSITLRWDRVTDASSYKILLSNNSSSKFEEYKTVAELSYQINDLEPKTEYRVKITTMKDKDGTLVEQETSGEITCKTLATVATPQNIRSNATTNSVSLEWNNIDQVTQYVVSVYENGNLIRTETVSENKCIITELDEEKMYVFTVQAFKDEESSEISNEIRVSTLSRKNSMIQELNNHLTKLKSDEDNKLKPVFGSGDLFLTVGDHEIYIKKEEGFSGDTTSLGVYNKKTGDWIVPYTTKSEFLTDGRIDIDQFRNKRQVGTNALSGGTKINYEGGTVISCKDYASSIWNYQWYYNFETDKLLCLFRTFGDWDYLYHTNDNLVLYDSGEVTSFNWNSGDEKTIVEGHIEAILDDSILVKIDENRYSSSDDHLALVNYQGKILIDLSDYETYSYHVGSHNTAYNGDKLLTVMRGKDSGIYACLINKDGTLAFDPIQLYKPEYDNNIDLMYLFDDFFVIARRTKGDKNQGIFFYDFSGTELYRESLE